MERREQLLREVLDARAQDVEPSPELWDEVQARIERRRRWRVSALVAAGAAAALVGVLVVPGLFGNTPAPEIEPLVPPAEDEPAEEPTDAAPDEAPEEAADDEAEGEETPAGDDAEEGAETPGEGLALSEPVIAIHDQELLMLGPDGAETLVELPSEGHSVFLSVAVRPGSTVDDLTIVTTTTAEGFEDVRWTRVIDGEVTVAHEAFEGSYAPAAATSEEAWTSPAVWSPDGRSVAWLDHGPDGTQLRTVGWDDGPGTGDPADDNASFVLTDSLPSGSLLNDWVEVDQTTSWLRATVADSADGWYATELVRQADGALSIEGDGTRSWGVAEPELGPAAAVGGETDDGAPRWLARLTDDGVLLEDVAMGERTDLPDDLLAGDGLPELWLRDHGDGVLVGSRNTATAYLVVDGEVTPLGVEVSDVAGLAP